jgi:hypothetical protein
MDTLEPARKCFRLVGGVLVERTVAEVHPAVTSNKEKIKSVIESLRYCSLLTFNPCRFSFATWRFVLLALDCIAAHPHQFAAGGEGENHPRVCEHA